MTQKIHKGEAKKGKSTPTQQRKEKIQRVQCQKAIQQPLKMLEATTLLQVAQNNVDNLGGQRQGLVQSQFSTQTIAQPAVENANIQ